MEYAREVRLSFGKRRRPAEKELTTPSAAAEWARTIIPMDDPREHLLVIGLAANGRPQAWHVAGIGTLDSCLVHPRDVFGPMMVAAVTCIILIHNHPSGNPTPSNADLAVTERLVVAGQLLGIPLLDHIVVTEDSFTSIRTLVAFGN